MTLRNQLLAALAAATLAAPVAFSQEPPSPPSPQDQDSADVGEPAPQDQQELPPSHFCQPGDTRVATLTVVRKPFLHDSLLILRPSPRRNRS